MKNESSLSSMRCTLHVTLLAFVYALLLVTVWFPDTNPDWKTLAARFVLAGTAYAGVVWSVNRFVRRETSRLFLYTVTVLALNGFLFGAVGPLQHIFIPTWMDTTVLAWEFAVMGTDVCLWMNQFVNPWLTEWMMFAYVIYVPLLLIVALICLKSAGPRAATDYLLNLSLGNMVCFTGFILFPVAGPMVHYPEQFTAPLNGWFFTWCGEWMRSNAHYPGGCLPSPHCAASTVMLVMVYRYRRGLFFALLPIVLTIYVSTVYGRYHYASDSVAGIAAAVIVLKLSPLVVRGVEYLARRTKHIVPSAPIPESVTE